MSSETASINSSQIDYSILVGKKIKVIAEQFPGQSLTTRIMSTGENNLVLDKSGSEGKISQLIQNQNVNLQFEYKGQEISFISSIVTSKSGRILVPLVETINPMVRRKFVRFESDMAVNLTYFTEQNFISSRLNKLKWFETAIANISGGGLLAFMPSMLTDDHFVLMNINIDDLLLPPLVLGRVCHSYRNDKNKFVTGIEFITNENTGKIISPSLKRNLPETIFQFENKTARELVKSLELTYRNNVE